MDTDKAAAIPAFHEALDGLVGLPWWSVRNGFGSMCSVDAGPMRRRRKPLRNAWLTTEEQEFEGEAQLELFCAWFVEAPTPVTWRTTDATRSRSGPLSQLVGRAVTAWEWEVGTPKLRLQLGANLALSVDCSVPSGLDDVFELVVGAARFELSSTGTVRGDDTYRR
jgi:hypothetical protein